MRTIRYSTAAVLAAAALAAALPGCGNNTTRQVAAMNKSNAQRIANIYSAFQQYKSGRGPKNEAEFKAFIKDFNKDNLSAMGIHPDKLDELFVSERDGQPFKIRFNVGGGNGAVAAVVFEQEGKDGQKEVAFTGNSKVEAVDSAAYAQLWAGKGESAPPAAPKIQKGGGGRPPGAPTGPPGK